jgi:hypothetical protein
MCHCDFQGKAQTPTFDSLYDPSSSPSINAETGMVTFPICQWTKTPGHYIRKIPPRNGSGDEGEEKNFCGNCFLILARDGSEDEGKEKSFCGNCFLIVARDGSGKKVSLGKKLRLICCEHN